MKQSMSRVAKCIDNGPMEGFWGILKRERYYGRRFTSREELVQMITDKMQRQLGSISEQVYGKLEKRMDTERRRRGL